MMRETRVNLKHLLEDIRDSYIQPVEETVIVELVANSLDSQASRIEFSAEPSDGRFTVCDNGKGMKRQIIKDYHNIAATTKVRGKGIGFAGVGAKLSLLLAKSVITESKGGRGSHCATQWYLLDEMRAPWNFIPSPGRITNPRGTAVTIELTDPLSPLLSEQFVSETIKKHFYPLLHGQFTDPILKYIYKKGVIFFINGREIKLENRDAEEISKSFCIKMGKRQKEFAGFGILVKTGGPSPLDFSGIGVSTYGKVIKHGWEWLGILPKTSSQICGMVEIPALARILTTNKNDFLRDAASLKRYYQYRKAIQEAVLPILEEFGESGLVSEFGLKKLRPLEKEIEKTLGYLLNDFPELMPLVGVRRKLPNSGVILSRAGWPSVGIIETAAAKTEEIPKETPQEGTADKERGKQKEKSSVPGLKIRFEENSDQHDLARMIQNTIWINACHPAFQKSKEENQQEYHILLCVAWTLSSFIEEERSPQDFISQFLASWAGSENKKSLKLF